jgi:(p)ppGpp synthase/HD superfamily hydrolase
MDRDGECVDMEWTKPQFSRGQVNKAGEHLVNEPLWAWERDKALAVINNWRSSHSYPLQVLKMTLLQRARKVDRTAVVAQRLKRLTSIAAKLKRFEGMQLARMQDIGGCRAVLNTVDHVDQLTSIYEGSSVKNPHTRPELIEKYDYIARPKEDGYRGIHYVYRYRRSSSTLGPQRSRPYRHLLARH